MTNHLMITADDLFNYKDFIQAGKWGYSPFGINVALPNLARLEARSTFFRRASATMPICAPSRASIMTGMSPAEQGTLDSKEWYEKVRPESLWTYQLRRAGYHIGTVGKIFHGYDNQPPHVREALYDSAPFTPVWNPSTVATKWGGGGGGNGWDGDEDQYYDSMVANTAVDFITNIAPTLGGKPWHFEAGFHHPHMSWDHPNRIFAQVSLDDIIMPTDWPLSWELLPFPRDTIGMNKTWSTPNPTTWTVEEIDFWKKTVRNYISAVIWVDEKLGEILDALEASPYNDNTLITFWSDHGYHLGDKGVWHKMTLWEEACNAPLLISAPGQTIGRDVWAPVSLVDVGPTVCDYLDVPYTTLVHGTSIRPLVEGGTMPERLILSFLFGSASGAVGDYRITAYQDGTTEYYNVITDPWLKTNLAGTGPNYADNLEWLLQTTWEWGIQLVEEGATIRPGSPFASYLGLNPSVTDVTNSFIVMGDLDARAKSPGYQRMWAMYPDRWTGDAPEVRMPPTVKSLIVEGTMTDGSVHGNELSNVVTVTDGSTNVVYLHGGNDVFGGYNSVRAVVYGGSGNDTITTGNLADTLVGGIGDDSLRANGGNDYLIGGAGNDTMLGLAGNDTIVADAGSDIIDAGTGADTIIVTGGSHILRIGDEAGDRIVINRTGEVQTVRSSTTVTLDLTDWAGLQPVRVEQVGKHVHVTAGMEKVICEWTTAANLAARITGVTTNVIA